MSIQGVNDLNSKIVICQSAGIFPGGTDARWQTGVRSSHGVRALAYLSSSDREISRRFQHPHVQLTGPVPVHGIRAIDLSGEAQASSKMTGT
jgi:hypothetical protein